MSLYLLRHTNVHISTGICYGQTDIKLASTYENEMLEVLHKLADKSFDEIYSSPLIRCTKLASDIANGKPIIIDSRLQELNFGQWEGLRWNIIDKKPEAAAWFADYVNVKCPNGESFVDLIKRVNEFYHEICTKNKNVLIVTHSGVIRSFMNIINGLEPQKTFKVKVDFGSITEFQIKKTPVSERRNSNC